jgi:TonB family protein
MSSAHFRREIEQSRRRTRRALGASVVLHALLFLWIFLLPRTAVSEAPLTEIAYLEPGELEAGSVGNSSPVSPVRPGAARAGEDVRFERVDPDADLELAPESPSAIGDRLSSRLAALQSDAAGPAAGPLPATGPGPSWGPATGPVGTLGAGGGGALALARGGGGAGGAPALVLARGGGAAGAGVAPALAATALPTDQSSGAAPARDAGVSARRVLAGASLAGPIADRPILHMQRPEYPDWAKRDGVEGSVTLYFVVRPDGGVKENVLVQKTAGFEDFDESARTALLAWSFAKLPGGRTGEQWGTITFHFRLRDTQ